MIRITLWVCEFRKGFLSLRERDKSHFGTLPTPIPCDVEGLNSTWKPPWGGACFWGPATLRNPRHCSRRIGLHFVDVLPTPTPFELERPNSARWPTLGKGAFLLTSHACYLVPRRRGPALLIFCDPYTYAFTVWPRQMLKRDHFAVVNVLVDAVARAQSSLATGLYEALLPPPRRLRFHSVYLFVC